MLLLVGGGRVTAAEALSLERGERPTGDALGVEFRGWGLSGRRDREGVVGGGGRLRGGDETTVVAAAAVVVLSIIRIPIHSFRPSANVTHNH